MRSLAHGDIQYETDRAKFLGRGTLGESGGAARETDRFRGCGTGSDFQFALPVPLDAREQWEIAFVTVAGGSREAVLD